MTACNKQERVKFITPPAALLGDCPETRIAVATNGDLVRKIRTLRTDLAKCNADKAALREWADTLAR